MKKNENLKKIAYLGPPGTFSHLAAKMHLKKQCLKDPNTTHPFPTIADVFEALEKGKTTHAIVPKENSTEGSVNQTLDLLKEVKIYINHEITIPIHHQLLSKYQDLKKITKVISHPQPLAQCRKWLKIHLPEARLLEVDSSTSAIQQVITSKENLAVIGSFLSAELYHLPIIRNNIEDDHLNTTRFIVLGQKKNDDIPDLKKTSILFSLPDEPGALVGILKIFNQTKINLNKIESRPSNIKQFDYFFFIDFNGSEYDSEIKKCLEKIKMRCQFYKFLGSYTTSLVEQEIS